MLVHGQDIRIPLGLDDTSATESWTAVLDFLVMPKARRGFVSRSLQGFQFVASDVDWAHGTGDEVRGRAVALALAMMGRRARLEDLTGPGVSQLVGKDLSRARAANVLVVEVSGPMNARSSWSPELWIL